MIIDVHAHVLDDAYLAELSKSGTFGFKRLLDGTYSVPGYGVFDPPIYWHEERLNDLARRGVDIQLVSPVPTFLAWPGGGADVAWTRRLNLSTAACVSRSGGRFKGLATVPFGAPDQAAYELERAVGEHGFVGAEFPTYAGDRPLDDPSLDAVFTTCERLGLIVFMHPTSADPMDRWQKFLLSTVLSWPNETTLAVARLIYSGVLERHPNFHLALAHGGGNLAYMQGRIDLGYNAPKYEYNADAHKHISRAPSTYYKQLFFDTAVGFPHALKFLVELVGPERVVYGSDEPFEIADPKGEMAVPTVRSLGKAAAEKILGGNLEAILAAQKR